MFSVFDDVDARILSSVPEGPVHDPDDCPLCQLETLRLYDLTEQLQQKTRRILHRFRSR